jgi:hypothetical protein
MTQRALHRDESGTILVVGLFAAAFLFGAVYFVLGVGDAVSHREVMQDAADTGAYGLAVLHARAMNMVALLNMVKLSVAVTVTMLLAVMVGAAKTIAFIQASQARLIALGAAIPILAAIGAKATAEHTAIRADADAVVRAADRAQETLRQRLPEIAEAQMGRSVAAYGPPVERGSAQVQPLPIRRGQPLALCERVLPFARPPALDRFDPVAPAPAKVKARSETDQALMPSCLSLGIAAMELEPNTDLGGERLQLRYFVTGGAQNERGEQGLQVGAGERGQQIGEPAQTTLGFAQAEYYFDGEGAAAQTEADGLFALGWRARFRRFRSPDLNAEIGAACQGNCDGAAGSQGDLAERIAH